MPGQFGKYTGFDTVFRVGAAVKVLDIELPALGVIKKVLMQEIELRRCQLAVLFPPNGLLGVLVADDEFIFGAAAGVDAGFGAQRPTLDQLGFMVRERVLVKRWRGQVPMDGRKVLKAEFVGTMSAIS